jgi:diaminohydroxyphosphoribosylaminopyrimidine deaminase/5-amino-6-(5-phosphoribosylamino)uracil reductase
VVALERAGARARGATLYCTLEPCSHTGRTGPCVERIAAAGIARVVAAVKDPNPRVAGRGFDYLRRHGIEVVEDFSHERARSQNAPFFTWIENGRPFVVLKAAVSRDGFVGVAGRRTQLTGPVADRYFHRQRAEIDAIAVGSGTILADDPSLTARGAFRPRPLTRVIFDWRVRIPATARVFSTSTGPSHNDRVECGCRSATERRARPRGSWRHRGSSTKWGASAGARMAGASRDSDAAR